MKKMLKKGFTIVELVIVVAVIAILSAVLIPTFSSIVDTAQTGSDVSLVRNVNTILASENALEGKNATMEDALEDVKDGGYDITKLTPTNSDNDILWDQVNDRFVLRTKDGKYNTCGHSEETPTETYKLWKIYTEMPETQTYSIYWNGGALENAEVSVGFDAGTGSVAKVSYSGNAGQNVIINTHGGILNVAAPNDTVNHYGEANEVNVNEVASESYHEFGKATFIKVSVGRVVVESGAEIGGIHIAKDNVIVDNASGEALPTLTKESGVTFEGATEATEEAAKEAATNVVAPEFGDDVETRIGMNGYAFVDAFKAVKNGETIIVLNDVTLAETATMPADVTATLDLNGNKVTRSGGAVISMSSGTLTVKDSSSNNSGILSSNRSTIEVGGTANLNVEGGTIKSNGSLKINQRGAIKNTGSGTVSITGGTFAITNASCAMLNTGSGKIIAKDIVIGDANYSNWGSIAVNAGDGSVELSGITFYVNANGVAGALENLAAGSMKLENCTGSLQDGQMIVDGDTSAINPSDACYSTGTIDIIGGTYTCMITGSCGVKSFGDGTININGATFSTYGNDSHGVYVLGSATVNIENANIDTQTSPYTNADRAGYVVLISDMETPCKGTGKVTINGGTYKGYVNKDSYGSSIQVVCIGYGCSGYIQIEGGTFNAKPEVIAYGEVRAEVIAEGYEAVENDDGTWSVVAKA